MMRPLGNGIFLRGHQLLRSMAQSGQGCGRTLAASSTSGKVEVLDDPVLGGQVKVIRMDRPPVNSLNRHMLSSIIDCIDEIEKAKDVRGVIFDSALASVYCAGLDIMEMIDAEPDKLKAYWVTLQECWLRMYGLKLPVAAAICGHAPAGGTLIALCCDYRVMLDNPKLIIGLNEVRLGLYAPTWLSQSMINTIGQRPAERALIAGSLFSPAEALAMGIIDDKVTGGREDVLVKCREFLTKEMALADPMASSKTKLQARRPFLQSLRDRFQEEADEHVQLITSPETQKKLKAYVASLSKASSDKKKP